MPNALFHLMLVAGFGLPTCFADLSRAEETSAAAIAEKIEKGKASLRLAGIIEATDYAVRQSKPADIIVEALIVALDDDRPDIQSAAARALSAFGPVAEKAVPALIAHMQGFAGSSDGVFLWIDCSKALTAIGPTAVPFLLEAVGTGDDNTFKGICASLHELGPSAAPMEADAVVEAMVKLIEKETGPRRLAATYALIKLGPAAKAAVPALIEELDDEDFQNQLIACQALTAIGPDAKPAVKKLLIMIEEGNVSLRSHAALCLGAIGPVPDQDILRAILKKLEDPNQVVRERAMIGLGLMGKNAVAALPQVEKALEDKAFHAKPEAAFAYWRITGKSEKPVQFLLKWLDDPTHELLSMQKLGELGPDAKAAAPALLTKLKTDDISVQIEACEALARIGWDTPEVRKSLDLLTAHEDAELAAVASAAMKRLDENARQK